MSRGLIFFYSKSPSTSVNGFNTPKVFTALSKAPFFPESVAQVFDHIDLSVECIGGFKSPNILVVILQIGPSEKDVYNAPTPNDPSAPNSGESSE